MFFLFVGIDIRSFSHKFRLFFAIFEFFEIFQVFRRIFCFLGDTTFLQNLPNLTTFGKLRAKSLAPANPPRSPPATPPLLKPLVLKRFCKIPRFSPASPPASPPLLRAPVLSSFPEKHKNLPKKTQTAKICQKSQALPKFAPKTKLEHNFCLDQNERIGRKNGRKLGKLVGWQFFFSNAGSQSVRNLPILKS